MPPLGEHKKEVGGLRGLRETDQWGRDASTTVAAGMEASGWRGGKSEKVVNEEGRKAFPSSYRRTEQIRGDWVNAEGQGGVGKIETRGENHRRGRPGNHLMPATCRTQTNQKRRRANSRHVR